MNKVWCPNLEGLQALGKEEQVNMEFPRTNVRAQSSSS